MREFVVAVYSNFDGSMEMGTVFAKSNVEAGKIFLESKGGNTLEDMSNVLSYDELQQYVFDQDHAIGVLEINKRSWKNYSNEEASQMLALVQ